MSAARSNTAAVERKRRDFRPLWKPAAIISAVLILISLASFAARGLNLGIEFEGGSVWEVPDATNDVGDIRDALSPLGQGGASIQDVQVGGDRFFRVRAEVTEIGEEANAITNALADVSGVSTDDISFSTVGPSWGGEITDAAVRALLVFFVVMAIYISWRLEWRMAIGALVAVVHDMIITVGAYSLFQFEVTPATVIAFLTIMGYSIYDTIVVYDRVRDNEGRFAPSGKLTYAEIMSRSLGEVLARSINTTITSILPVLSMLVIGAGIMGASTLTDFSVALLIGLLVGAYSSLFVAAPMVVLLKSREERWASAGRRQDGATRGRPSAARSSAKAEKSSSTASASEPPTSGVIQPKGRKRNKRG